MPKYATDAIRNLAFMGAVGGGKTTLVEALLHDAGVIGRIGRVEDGNTVCDFEDLEKEFHHSLESALVHFDKDGVHVNLIDTPGGSDFIGRAISSLPAVETAVVVIDAASGIETVTRRVMKAAEESNRPRLIIVNKIDNATGLVDLLATIQETFGGVCRPINLPTDGGKSVVDCFENTSGASDIGGVGEHHTGLVDQVVEIDDALMEQYLEKGEVSPDQLRESFKQALREGHLVPVCFTSAREGVGIRELVATFTQLCPSPVEGNPVAIEQGSGDDVKTTTPDADAGKPPIAHVFRVTADPYVGKMAVFRVYQGSIGPDLQPQLDDRTRPIRIAHVFKLQGKNHTETDHIIAGDIGAVAKIEEIDFGSILHGGDLGGARVLGAALPKPMYGLAIEGTSKGAETKMAEALAKLAAEDPTFEVQRVQATGETVIRGLGEQHLRVKLRLLKDRYGVDVETRPPRVAYKETITVKAAGHHRHKKQTGGAGQFGEVFLSVEPLAGEDAEQANGLVFEDKTFGGSIPKQFLPAIEKGVRQVMHSGAVAGYPLQNIRVTVTDGKHHPVDSKEVAFTTAGRKAFIDGILKAKPVLLEPYVTMEITVPANQIGDISSDISGRRGRIQGTDMLPGNQAIVKVEAPLAEVMAYSNQLKSITGGAGSFTMEYSHDEQTPPNVQSEVVKAYKPNADED